MDDHDANAHHECNVSAALFANVPSAAAALAGLAPQLPHMFASAPMPAGGDSSVTSTIGRDMSWTTAMKDLVDNLIEKAQIHLLRNRVHLDDVIVPASAGPDDPDIQPRAGVLRGRRLLCGRLGGMK